MYHDVETVWHGCTPSSRGSVNDHTNFVQDIHLWDNVSLRASSLVTVMGDLTDTHPCGSAHLVVISHHRWCDVSLWIRSPGRDITSPVMWYPYQVIWSTNSHHITGDVISLPSELIHKDVYLSDHPSQSPMTMLSETHCLTDVCLAQSLCGHWLIPENLVCIHVRLFRHHDTLEQSANSIFFGRNNSLEVVSGWLDVVSGWKQMDL